MMWSGREMQGHFLTPPSDCRPGTYWWWHHGAVTREGVREELSLMKQAGISFAHIVTFDGVQQKAVPGHEQARVGSPEWAEHVAQCIQDAATIGVQVDLSPCPGWPLNGSWVPDDLAAQQLLRSGITLKGPQQFEGELPLPQDEDIVYEHDSWGKVRSVFEKAYHRPPVLTPEVVLLARSGESVQIILQNPRDNRRISVSIPEGEWTLSVFWRWSGGAFNPEHRVIDHYSARAVRQQMEWAVTPILRRIPSSLVGTTFSSLYLDNIEGFYEQTWTIGMRDLFQNRCGYDLVPYLPMLFPQNGACKLALLKTASASTNEVTQRVAADFLDTLAELNRKNCFGTMQEWARNHGLSLRAEGHMPARGDHIDIYGQADIPEMEVYHAQPLAERGLGNLRFAGHLYSHNILASESYTWQTPHFRATLQTLREASDELFSLGVNRINNHGWCYSPKEAGWPGWMFYCSSDMNHNNSWFPMLRGLEDYVARNSVVLRAGTPVVDVAFLGGSGPSLQSAGIGDSSRKADRVTELALLNRARVEGGFMRVGFGKYKVLVLRPEAKTVSLELMTQIERLVKQGANVVTLGRPAQVPGLKDYKAREKGLSAIVARLFPDHRTTEPKKVGRGRAWWIEAKDYECVLEQIGVSPQLVSPAGDVPYEHRQGKDFDTFFVFNASTLPLKGEFGFRAAGHLQLWDAKTGGVRSLQAVSQGGLMRAALSIPARTGRLLVFRTGQVAAALPAADCTPAILAEITGPWQTEFRHVDRRTPFLRTIPSLADWSTIEELRYFSGMGVYQRTFTLDSEPAPGQCRIDLGVVRDAARVELNGRDLGILIEAPYQVDIPPGLLRVGENRLVIDVCNLMENAIVPLLSKPEPGNKTWSGPFIKREDLEILGVLHPGGLLGPVRLLHFEK